ncbi:MAG: AraC family transcriptional regulator [Zoogloeaceae bacterium]|nr:AraC family transcriptional regulator [Zoogloeaceae bacterium]
MTSLAILLIGFSLFSALSLAFTHFRSDQYKVHERSRRMGQVLLVCLCILQVAHFVWLHLDLPWVQTLLYRMTLFSVAPTFYLFSQPLLKPDVSPTYHPAMLAHVLPLIVVPFLPSDLALPLAFIIGAGYLLWLGRSLYVLRDDREDFFREMMILGVVFGIAIGVSLLGLVQASLQGKLFFSLYSIAIGIAFFLVHTALGLRPQLPAEVSETAQAAYGNSTLKNVDCENALLRLEALMTSERLYASPELSLPILAEQLGLSTHQLSELMNARLGKGFSRYLRERRVMAAKIALCNEPSASVLSIGLCVGFTSQSNFYEAFREIEGTTPGQYRKLQRNGESE